MIRSFTSLVSLFLSSAIAQQIPREPDAALVFTHFTVIDATSAPANPDVTVTISGYHITALTKSGSTAVAKNARIVDATGRFLIRGLWDMHIHPPDKDYLPLFIANGVTRVRVMWGFPAHLHSSQRVPLGGGSLPFAEPDIHLLSPAPGGLLILPANSVSRRQDLLRRNAPGIGDSAPRPV